MSSNDYEMFADGRVIISDDDMMTAGLGIPGSC